LERLTGQAAWPLTKYIYLVEKPHKYPGENGQAERNESLAPGFEYREARITATHKSTDERQQNSHLIPFEVHGIAS